jgi:hypothetical protein
MCQVEVTEHIKSVQGGLISYLLVVSIQKKYSKNRALRSRLRLLGVSAIFTDLPTNKPTMLPRHLGANTSTTAAASFYGEEDAMRTLTDTSIAPAVTVCRGRAAPAPTKGAANRRPGASGASTTTCNARSEPPRHGLLWLPTEGRRRAYCRLLRPGRLRRNGVARGSTSLARSAASLYVMALTQEFMASQDSSFSSMDVTTVGSERSLPIITDHA